MKKLIWIIAIAAIIGLALSGCDDDWGTKIKVNNESGKTIVSFRVETATNGDFDGLDIKNGQTKTLTLQHSYNIYAGVDARFDDGTFVSGSSTYGFYSGETITFTVRSTEIIMVD